MLFIQKQEYSGHQQGIGQYWTAVFQVEVFEEGKIRWGWGLYRGTLDNYGDGDVSLWESQEDPKLFQFTIKKVKEVGRLLFSILETQSTDFPALLETISSMSLDDMMKELTQEKYVALHLIAFPHLT